jgi:hypothetical protein
MVPMILDTPLFIYDGMNAHRAAYETIIDFGRLELIRDTALVREIPEYCARVEAVERFVEAQRQTGVSPVDRRSMEELVELVRADPATMVAGKHYRLITNRHLMYLTNMKSTADTAARLLATEFLP